MADKRCVSCGKPEIDVSGDVSVLRMLFKCPGCDVHFCSEACQRQHNQIHESRDEILFKQPKSSYLGDCPICFVPLPLDPNKSGYFSCCSARVCNGCAYANLNRETEQRLKQKCPFCRYPMPKTDEGWNAKLMKRVEANDPVAIREVGTEHASKGDIDGAVKYWKRAAELGDAMAHHNLALAYRNGDGVEQDEGKAVYHSEQAAIAGDPTSRFNLGAMELRNGRFERAVKHLIIAANLGYNDAIQQLKECYKHGDVSKDDFAAALRAHQAAVNATKNAQREAGEKFYSRPGM